MKHSLRALAFLAALLPSWAFAQTFPTVPDHSVIGRIGVGGSSGPSQAIPFTSLPSAFFGAQSANQVFAGPSSGIANVPTFRALVAADITALPSVVFANPSGAIGLTANNGSATTAPRSDGTPALSQAIVPTWTGTHTFNNGTFSAVFSGGPVGINNAAPTIPLHVGGVAAASTGANVLSARASAGTTSVHGFAENSTIALTAAAQGMDSYDARMVVSGTQTYDHLVSYQSRAIYGSSGVITNAYGGFDSFTANGPVTNQYGWYVALPVGSGTITNSYGFYAEALTKGSTLNYAFFSAGATKSKFTGGLEGTTTNDNACAGCIGEPIDSAIGSGSAVTLVNATAKTVTSISLTAGDWEVSGSVALLQNTSTGVSDIRGSLSLVTNTEDVTPGRFSHFSMAAVTPGAVTWTRELIPNRFSLSATTSIFLIAQESFSGAGPPTAYGIIHARRVR